MPYELDFEALRSRIDEDDARWEAGETTLTMVLRREWDPENPDDRFEVTVNVRQ